MFSITIIGSLFSDQWILPDLQQTIYAYGSLSIGSIIFVLDRNVSKGIELLGKLIVPIEKNYGLVTNITFSS